jgi:hypothetical protein
MPQVFIIAALGTAAYVGLRYLKRTLSLNLTGEDVPVRIKSVYLERGSDGIFRPTGRVSKDRI